MYLYAWVDTIMTERVFESPSYMFSLASSNIEWASHQRLRENGSDTPEGSIQFLPIKRSPVVCLSCVFLLPKRPDQWGGQGRDCFMKANIAV